MVNINDSRINNKSQSKDDKVIIKKDRKTLEQNQMEEVINLYTTRTLDNQMISADNSNWSAWTTSTKTKYTFSIKEHSFIALVALLLCLL